MSIDRVAKTLLAVMLLLAALPAMAQEAQTFSVSNVIVGPQRLETLYAVAMGKWSDAGAYAAPFSTEVHCYKRFGFCEVATAISVGKQAAVFLDSFDILRGCWCYCGG